MFMMEFVSCQDYSYLVPQALIKIVKDVMDECSQKSTYNNGVYFFIL
jgi:hypothetical protein